MATGGQGKGSAYLSASGAVGVAGKPKMIYSALLISTGTAGILSLKNNGTGGTLYVKATGTINTGVIFNFGAGFFFPTDCYCTVDGNTTSVLVSYDEVIA